MRTTFYLLFFVHFLVYGQLSPCQQEAANATGLIGAFVPQCEEGGSYSSVQCWFSTGYCWCVNADGIEIPGTSIQSWLGTPDCGLTQDACTLLPEAGPCFAAIQGFYFNQETQQCDDFTWGGCAGVLPFASLPECEAATCASSLALDQLESVQPKLTKMIDLFGRAHHTHKLGQLLFYIYDNGKVEKRITSAF
jgi:hypothetical protein